MIENGKQRIATQSMIQPPIRRSGVEARIEELAMWSRAVWAYSSPSQVIRRSSTPGNLNTVPEALVIRESLLVIISLCNKVLFENGSSKKEGSALNGTEDYQSHFARLASQLRTLREMMGGLSLQDTLTQQSFSSFARAIRRELLECPPLNIELVSNPITDPPPSAAKVIPMMGQTAYGSILLEACGTLFYDLQVLRHIETHLSRDGILKRCLPLFAMVLDDCKRTANLVARRVVGRLGVPTEIKDGIDGAVYCLELEARKVSEHELVGVASARNTIELFAHVENAHGILRDAIQQAVVGIYGSFDPSMKGESLFQSFSTKLEQSMKLRDEIWKLLARMRSFEREPQPARVNRLVQAVMAFREESLRLLMFKDWELYYTLVEELTVARSLRELLQALHKFATFLETLLGQISLRAVLLNHPFDYPELALED